MKNNSNNAFQYSKVTSRTKPQKIPGAPQFLLIPNISIMLNSIALGKERASLVCITYRTYHIWIWYIVLTTVATHAYDQPYFYRAAYFLGEPRFEKAVLTSLDFFGTAGHTRHARNVNGDKTRLFDIYNVHNMHNLADNVSPSNNSTVNTIVENLRSVEAPSNSLFAHLSFGASCTIAEIVCNLYQNFVHGFFCQCTVPIKHATITAIQPCDLSPYHAPGADQRTPAWVDFLDHFHEIMHAYDLTYRSSFKKNAVGDITGVMGWTHTYEDTIYLDFIDVTFKAGLVFPTAARTDQDLLFDFPLGNDGHLGFPLFAQASIGLYDWLTIGCSTQAIVFADDVRCLRTKTAPEQSGMIMLHKESVNYHRGPLFDATLYIKSDHIPLNFSLLVGYSYTHKRHDFLTPLRVTSDVTVINNDQRWQGWNMHTLHLMLEYDFTKRDTVVGPRLAALVNIPLGGKQIFDVTMAGIDAGFDMSWNF